MIAERGCWERGCACYDDRLDKDGVEVCEASLIATLEQENRQLRARNERLTRESRAANDDQILAMWKAAEGHGLRFARMLESYHGIGGESNVQPI